MRKRGRWVALAIVLGVAGYVALGSGDYSVWDVRRAQQDVADWQDELDQLKQETDSLQARVDSLQNDPSTLETLAREDFGLIREDELLYRIVEPSDTMPVDSLGDGHGGTDGSGPER